MALPLVSVVTVTLNAEPCIRLTLTSVQNQTYPEIEHVIVDGVSSDRTIEIAKEYPKTKIHSGRDKGVYHAMEKAIQYVNGDFVIFLNAGDLFFDRNVCAKIVDYFRKTKADILFGNLMPVYLRQSDTHSHPSFSEGVLIDGSSYSDYSLLYHISIHHQATFYRAKMLKSLTFIHKNEVATGEYNLLLQALVKKKAKVRYVPVSISRFALGGISTRSFDDEWRRYVEGRDVLRNTYFPDGEPRSIPGYFLGEVNETTPFSVRIKHYVKRLIKKSVFFKIYARFVAHVGGVVAVPRSDQSASVAELVNALSKAEPKIASIMQSLLRIDVRQLESTQQFSLALEKSASQIDDIEKAIALLTSERESTIQTLNSIADYQRHYGESTLQGIRQSIFEMHAEAAAIDRRLRRSLNLLGKFAEANQIFSPGEPQMSIYSQWDEDGLLAGILRHLKRVPERFVEIGVGDFSEANTRYLLETRNWSGAVIDIDAASLDRLRASEIYWRHDLKVITASVNKENINSLVSGAAKGKELGVFSIDVDGVDYWLLEALEARPWVIILEFNSVFGPTAAVTVPYDENFERWRAHHSGVYAGASLEAFKTLLGQRGYRLVAINSASSNAFFVRSDVLPDDFKVSEPEFRYSPVSEARNSEGVLLNISVEDAQSLISNMEVVDVTKGEVAELRYFTA
jgi:glycosyltransferase involved in cell wall biosynthesis